MTRSLALPGSQPPALGLRGLGVAAGRVPAVAVAVAGAWLLLAGSQLTGTSGLLHHHALIEHGPALWIALPAFAVAWLVMVAAMMLPASLPAIAAHLATVARSSFDGGAQASLPLAKFLAPYALVWAAFGVAVFLGDTVVHRVVDATPWLEARTWLIDAAVLGFAGLYQFTPIKRGSLEACRHPGAAPFGGGGRFGPGLDHALACLAGSGPLMLLMFSEGFSSPAWMVALTGVMAYEATGRHGRLAATTAGVLLIGASLVVTATAAAL